MRTKTWLYLTAILLCTCCSRQDARRDAIARLRAQYPQATVQDVYKTFYQDRFGSGHLITDTASVRAWLLSEIEAAAEDTIPNPYYEPTGAEGRYVRVYLRCVNDSLLTADQLLDAFLRSATPPVQPKQTWADEWQALVQSAATAGMTCPDSIIGPLTEASRTNRAVRHSDTYRNAYHPHYRIVERAIFENELLPFINAK